MTDELPFSPSAERNKVPIGAALTRWLPRHARVLEIGSGTGQHAVWFGQQMPGIRWQCSELPNGIDALRARLSAEAPVLPDPIRLDVSRPGDWPQPPWDAVYTANTLHIMPWNNTPALIRNAAAILRSHGLLIVYGPFRDGERFDADSNRAFDADLKRRDPAMGLRDALTVRDLAEAAGLGAEVQLAMPANNRLLIFRKIE